jgi:hypothetical protein
LFRQVQGFINALKPRNNLFFVPGQKFYIIAPQQKLTSDKRRNMMSYIHSLYSETKSGFFISLILILLCPAILPGQCLPYQNACTDGEKIVFNVTYNWGPIWIKAGYVTFTSELSEYKGSPAWHLTSYGRTYSSFEFLYKVRDTYETWIDTGNFQTLEFRRYIYESGYTLQNTSWFDYRNEVVYSNTKIGKKPLRTDTLPMKPCTFDMLSSCYFVRSMNLDTLKVGDRFPVHVSIEDSVYTVPVTYRGIEVVMNEDGIKYRCKKFSATMVQGTIFEEDKDAFIWITDDDNRIPVYVEAKIIVGYVKAFLKEAKGLKKPMKEVVVE